MLGKIAIAAIGLIAIYWVLALETSFLPLFYEVCEKAKDSSAEQCASYNFVSYALFKIVGFLDLINTVVVAISTAAVAVFTYTLSKSTKDLYTVTKTAADAADLSARAAIALELPIILSQPVGFSIGDSQKADGTQTENFGLQCFEFKNLGRTKAFPINLRWGWNVGDTLPLVPIYKLDKSFDLMTIINADNGLQVLYVRDFDMELSLGDTERIFDRSGEVSLWVYCCLTYEDFMQIRHEAGFCWQRQETFGSGRFIPDATPAYNKKT